MTTEVLGGTCGLLSGTPVKWDNEAWRQQLERDREWEAAVERAQARVRQTCDQLAALWAPGLETELRHEAATIQSAQIDKDWNSFVEFCKKYRLPSLPAPAGAVVAYLGQSKAKDVARLYRSIRSVHDTHFGHPCDDVLVRAVVRASRTEKKTPPSNGKGTH
jgi:hypothetical protein